MKSDPEKTRPEPDNARPELTKARLLATRSAGFWQDLYTSGEDGWDMRSVHRGLPNVYGAGLFGAARRVLVPGAGRGHDALFLASQGLDVVACDFAETPVEAMRSARDARGLSMDVREMDVFALMNEPAGSYDAIFDYTFYCAIDPAERDRYRDLAAHLIRPGGRLILFAFPLNRDKAGPPHSMTIPELKLRFAGAFDWVLDETMPASPSPRRPNERLVLMIRRTS